MSYALMQRDEPVNHYIWKLAVAVKAAMENLEANPRGGHKRKDAKNQLAMRTADFMHATGMDQDPRNGTCHAEREAAAIADLPEPERTFYQGTTRAFGHRFYITSNGDHVLAEGLRDARVNVTTANGLGILSFDHHNSQGAAHELAVLLEHAYQAGLHKGAQA